VLGFVAILAVAACDTPVAPVDSGDTASVEVEPQDDGDDADGDGGGGKAVTYDDVEPILADHCGGCHGSPTSGGAPFSLDGYQDAADRIDRIVARAVDGDPRPMPPSGLELTNKEANTLIDWLDAGAPRN
jgi:mono/diheme cytochrome c family protein